MTNDLDICVAVHIQMEQHVYCRANQEWKWRNILLSIVKYYFTFRFL